MYNYAISAIVASLAIPISGISAPTAGADTTLVLFEHDTQQNLADLGAPGPGPGDQFLFSGDVFDRPGGEPLGTVDGTCTTLTGNDKSGQSACSGKFYLAGGQIFVAGVVDTAALFVRGDAVPVSIFGGTGVYQDARGNGTIQVPPDVPNQADANIVLNVAGG